MWFSCGLVVSAFYIDRVLEQKSSKNEENSGRKHGRRIRATAPARLRRGRINFFFKWRW